MSANPPGLQSKFDLRRTVFVYEGAAVRQQNTSITSGTFDREITPRYQQMY
jgi:hypothetical protein